MKTPHWLRSMGWATIVAISLALFAALVVKVNTVKSEVLQAERRILALRTEKMMLETEFETRSNQQQLSQWNDVDYGYKAPGAAQFLENERQLAMLGTPRGPGAPAPIRVMAANEQAPDEVFPQMVSPMTGQLFASGDGKEQLREQRPERGLSEALQTGAARVSLTAGMGVVE